MGVVFEHSFGLVNMRSKTTLFSIESEHNYYDKELPAKPILKTERSSVSAVLS